MDNPRYSLRMPRPLAERLEDYGDELDINDSEAIRRLVERGLESRDDPDALLERISLALAVSGFVAFLAFWMAWSFFDWALLVEPVLVPLVLTAAYLGAAWGVNRHAWRRSR